MDVTVTESGPCRKTMTIVVPPERIKAHVDQAFRAAAGQLHVKGFRRGKTPRQVLEKRFGPEILSEAKVSLVRDCCRAAFADHNLVPLGEPEVDDLGDAPLDASSPLELRVHFDVRPQLELGSVRGLKVPRVSDEVTEAEVEAALAELADRKRSLKSAAGPVADGDFVKADLVFKDAEGQVVHERPAARLNTNIPIAGTDPQAFADQLRGSEVGQQLQVDITFPDSFEKQELRGARGTVHLAVLEILRVTPAAIDDQLAKSYDFEDLAALKADLLERLGEQKREHNRRRQEGAAFEALLQENPFPVPESMVEAQAQYSLDEFRRRLVQAGVEAEELERRVSEAEAEARAEAEQRVRLFFLNEAIAEKEKIFVTEGDVDVAMRAIASDNDATLAQVQEYYQDYGRLANLRLAIKERKVRDFLREHATQTD